MTDQPDNWKPASNPWAVAVVTLAVFIRDLDTTIVNVALPHVARLALVQPDESTGINQLRWLTASSCPSRRFSAGCLATCKQFFLICIVMFTVCSFLCRIATELWQIILFRVMQGFLAAACGPRSSQCCTLNRKTGGKAFWSLLHRDYRCASTRPSACSGGWITDNYSGAGCSLSTSRWG